MTTKQKLTMVGMMIGLALLVASLLVPKLVPTQLLWSPDQAEHHALVSGRLHQMKHEMGHLIEEEKNPDQVARYQQQLDQAQREFQESRAALDRAAGWRAQLPRILRWSGVSVLVVSVLASMAQSGEEDRSKGARARPTMAKK